MSVRRPSVGRLSRAAYRLAPAASVALAMTLDLLWPGSIGPLFTFCVTFGWSVVWPERFSPLTAFTAGLILDLLKGWPAGLSALTLVLLRSAAVTLIGPVRAPSVTMIWKSFSVVLPPVLALRWLVVSGWWGHAFAPAPFLVEGLTTWIAMPVVVRLLVPTPVRPRAGHAT